MEIFTVQEFTNAITGSLAVSAFCILVGGKKASPSLIEALGTPSVQHVIQTALPLPWGKGLRFKT